MYQNELYHHGVKGMKWGVRRYQNADGTLTAAGKKRELKRSDKAIRKERKQAAKYRRGLSDKELNARIDRLQREKRLRELSEQDMSAGRSTAKRILSSAGTKVAAAAVAGTAAYVGKMVVSNLGDMTTYGPNPKVNVNWKELAGYAFPNPKKK